MNNTNLIEFNKMYLDIITPVNIASNEKLNTTDYIYDSKNQVAYFLNPLLWHKFIYTKKLFPAYMDFINDKAKPRKILYKWLIEQGYNIEDIKEVVKYKLIAHENIDKISKDSLNDIILQTKLIDGSAYIPGSTLKGLIRTAILYDLLQKNPHLKQRLWQSLERAINGNKSYDEIKRVENNLNRLLTAEIEGTGKREYTKYDKKSTKSEYYNFMQGIKLSDAMAETKHNNLVLLKKIDLAVKDNYIKENSLSVYRECIEPKTRFYFDMQIEKRFTQKLNINSAEDILIMIQNFFDASNELLSSAFGKDYGFLFNDANLGNTYIGGGTGFLTKTLVAYLVPTKMKAKEFISRYLNMKFKQRVNSGIRDTKIAPRTLKATKYNGKLTLLGIAKIGKV
ncbi:type III-A CRISPR-associated RAMP protein Csm5 [uncultured Megamonas sp.]|uniref:type III-A CRISPR-associated RAMP protein Csm5 n=1 Tax=uncultured Megamonas sp. TaxID=286140 RepID=UPI0025F8F7C3|nr:type III-A CRISPR-associated RAMP protein Csm5 [uncultured Megamonas sp.]